MLSPAAVDATAVAVEVVVLVADISRMRVPMKVKAMRKVHVQLILIPNDIDPFIISTRFYAVGKIGLTEKKHKS